MRLRLFAFPVRLGVFVAASLGSARASADPVLATPEPGPVGIANGELAMSCAWPMAVAVTDDAGSLCTGTLVHPRVVMYAAHCGGGDKRVLFGQKIATPLKNIGTELCMTYPGYAGVNDQEHDWAFCRLNKEINEIPITPVVFGCETSMVQAGATAAITGFGITVQNGNGGVKNWGLTPIHSVQSMAADVGGFGDPGICPGDSGGPALLRYPDGSWHVFGIASTLTGNCGGEGTHSLAWNAVPWIEEESGVDITPCHDVDGTWNPTHRCTGFYAGEAGVGHGEFTNWCPGTPASASSSTCGAAFDAAPDDTPPTVAITSPMTSAYPDQNSLSTEILVEAQDGDGWGVAAVRIKINGDEQAVSDTYAPYAFPVKFPKGTYEIVAVAEDAAGLISESQPVVLEIGMVEVPEETTGETGETGDADTSPTNASTPTSEGGTGETPAEDSGELPTSNGSNGEGEGEGGWPTATPGTLTDPPATGEDGCGCRSQTPTSAAPWLLGLLLAIRRRRSVHA